MNLLVFGVWNLAWWVVNCYSSIREFEIYKICYFWVLVKRKKKKDFIFGVIEFPHTCILWCLWGRIYMVRCSLSLQIKQLRYLSKKKKKIKQLRNKWSWLLGFIIFSIKFECSCIIYRKEKVCCIKWDILGAFDHIILESRHFCHSA